MRTINLVILGQVKSGKNNMMITRSGRHYPNPKWAEWRDNVLVQLSIHRPYTPMGKPIHAIIDYYAGDRRIRDVPGMMDALWHCLERGGIVENDGYIGNVSWRSFYDKENPRVRICLTLS